MEQVFHFRFIERIESTNFSAKIVLNQFCFELDIIVVVVVVVIVVVVVVAVVVVVGRDRFLVQERETERRIQPGGQSHKCL